MIRIQDYITIDKEILGGQSVFSGTRVPVETLFEHLESGITLGEFLKDFPGVKKDQAIAVVEFARKILAKDIPKNHKKIITDRLKKLKSEELLDWEKVKNDFIF